jgi:hypothetical protein
MRKVVFVVFVLLFVFSFVVAEYDGIAELDLPETGFVRRSEALVAINESEVMIEEMRISNFSVIGVVNTLDEAKRIFRLVDYSEVLRNASASSEERWEAVKALGEIDWRYLHYGEVLEYADEITEVYDMAFLSYNSLILAKVIYEEYSEKGLLNSGGEELELIEKSEDAFYDERYAEAENLALMAQEIAEAGAPRVSFFGRVKGGVSGFFGMCWIYVLVFMVFVLSFFHKRIVAVFRGE